MKIRELTTKELHNINGGSSGNPFIDTYRACKRVAYVIYRTCVKGDTVVK